MSDRSIDKVNWRDTKPKEHWYFEESRKKGWEEKWTAMSEEYSSLIEENFLQGNNNFNMKIKYRLGKDKEFEYSFDLEKRTQTNTKSAKVRKILRATWFLFGETQRIPYPETTSEILENSLMKGELKDGAVVPVDEDRFVKKKDGKFKQLRGKSNGLRAVERGYKNCVVTSHKNIIKMEDYYDPI